MEEVWKPIFDHPLYEASSLGRIARVGGRVLKPRVCPRGYESVILSMSNKIVHRQVNRLVCDAFNGPPPTPKHEAAHLDGRSNNNRPGNLEWKTRKENELDKIRHGTALRRDRHNMAKLSEQQVADIRLSHGKGVKSGELARKHGVDRTHIWRIVRHKNWTNVTITDRAAVLAFFANNDQVTEVLQKLAEKVTAAGVTVPGVTVIEDQRAA